MEEVVGFLARVTTWVFVDLIFETICKAVGKTITYIFALNKLEKDVKDPLNVIGCISTILFLLILLFFLFKD
ncbi:MAG: hypothetical protein ABXS91_03245 [Sulfurimonas sp.]